LLSLTGDPVELGDVGLGEPLVVAIVVVGKALGFIRGASTALFVGPEESSNSSERWASTANLDTSESVQASASTRVASKKSSPSQTKPALRHISTISSKKRLKISRP
jgi:hypothetical protein